MEEKKEQPNIRPSINDEQPRVVVAGQSIDQNSSHTGGVVFGVMLLFGGILLLLNTLGVVSWDVWDRLWQFWPLLLILFGLHIILGSSGLARVLMFVVSVVALGLVVLYGLREVGSPLTMRLPASIEYLLTLIQQARP